MKFTVPILLMTWRRPLETSKVIKALSLVKPENLFISSDGPIPDDPIENKKVLDTRSIIERDINWKCNIQWLRQEVNLGCKLGCTTAIDWFFQNVEEGIILEDDTLPHPDFFQYCQELLQKYRTDDRVWCISGSNFQNGNWRGDGSYYFGRFPLLWGWAGWRNIWEKYDFELKEWPILKDSEMLDFIFNDPLEKEYWSNIWENLFSNGEPDTWCYQWCMKCVINNALIATPNKNLISNIGFGPDAAHTKWEEEPMPIDEGLGDIIHPTFMIRHALADQYQFDYKFGGASIRARRNIPARIKNKLKRLLNLNNLN